MITKTPKQEMKATSTGMIPHFSPRKKYASTIMKTGPAYEIRVMSAIVRYCKAQNLSMAMPKLATPRHC